MAIVLSAASSLDAGAFVVEGPERSDASALENLAEAPRWGLSTGSFLTTGERGLGGGLEYALDDSLCRLNFVDGATCEDARTFIRSALDIWASGHPAIQFVDVSDQVQAAYPRREDAGVSAGAEIDFFATSPRAFQGFSQPSINGYTVFYDEEHPSLVLTNGHIAKGPIGAIIASDVHFNTANCYYIDPDQVREDCVHFPSLVLHEIGHVLGIGHPEENAGLNLDDDGEPGNEIAIDCRAPLSGLKAYTDYDGASVAHGLNVHRPGRWLRGLSWDDVAARDALYPHCGIQRKDRAPVRWGAFALSGNGSYGAANLASSSDEAEAVALQTCQANGASCRTVRTFRSCYAFARSAEGAVGQAVSARSDYARADAIFSCSEHGSSCKLVADFCAYE
ncbi:MAG: DUF4189 domain-containing protein [Pseudomonadota bacterium]